MLSDCSSTGSLTPVLIARAGVGWLANANTVRFRTSPTTTELGAALPQSSAAGVMAAFVVTRLEEGVMSVCKENLAAISDVCKK